MYVALCKGGYLIIFQEHSILNVKNSGSFWKLNQNDNAGRTGFYQLVFLQNWLVSLSRFGWSVQLVPHESLRKDSDPSSSWK